jgi:hypothetical protein
MSRLGVPSVHGLGCLGRVYDAAALGQLQRQVQHRGGILGARFAASEPGAVFLIVASMMSRRAAAPGRTAG